MTIVLAAFSLIFINFALLGVIIYQKAKLRFKKFKNKRAQTSQKLDVSEVKEKQVENKWKNMFVQKVIEEVNEELEDDESIPQRKLTIKKRKKRGRKKKKAKRKGEPNPLEDLMSIEDEPVERVMDKTSEPSEQISDSESESSSEEEDYKSSPAGKQTRYKDQHKRETSNSMLIQPAEIRMRRPLEIE